MNERLNTLLMCAFVFALGAGVVWAGSVALHDHRAGRAPVTLHSASIHEVRGRTVTVELFATRHRDCALDVFTHWWGADGVISVQRNQNKAVLAVDAPGRFRLPVTFASSVAGNVQFQTVAIYTCPDGREFRVASPVLEAEIDD